MNSKIILSRHVQIKIMCFVLLILMLCVSRQIDFTLAFVVKRFAVFWNKFHMLWFIVYVHLMCINIHMITIWIPHQANFILSQIWKETPWLIFWDQILYSQKDLIWFWWIDLLWKLLNLIGNNFQILISYFLFMGINFILWNM